MQERRNSITTPPHKKFPANRKTDGDAYQYLWADFHGILLLARTYKLDGFLCSKSARMTQTMGGYQFYIATNITFRIIP